MKKIIKHCPSCQSELVVTRLNCKNCLLEITGEFNPETEECMHEDFNNLTNEEATFVRDFLTCSGNFSRLQEIRNESYLTVKENLKKVQLALNLRKEENNIEEAIKMIETNDNEGKVVSLLKRKIQESGGRSYAPMLKGEPMQIFISPDGEGILAEGLMSLLLKWEHFEAIVNKANELGGKMYKGDAAAQSGAAIGSKQFPLDTIDAFVATNFFGTSVGSTALRRSTYYSIVLAWAGIAHNCKSDGHGGYILIKPEFRK